MHNKFSGIRTRFISTRVPPVTLCLVTIWSSLMWTRSTLERSLYTWAAKRRACTRGRTMNWQFTVSHFHLVIWTVDWVNEAVPQLWTLAAPALLSAYCTAGSSSSMRGIWDLWIPGLGWRSRGSCCWLLGLFGRGLVQCVNWLGSILHVDSSWPQTLKSLALRPLV